MQRLLFIHPNQTGAITLLLALVLISILGLMSIYSAQLTITEQKISSNYYRTKQGFEAAQAGLDAVIPLFNFNFVENSLLEDATGNNLSFANESINLPVLNANSGLQKSQSVGQYSVAFYRNTYNSEFIEIQVSGFAGDNFSQFPNQIITENVAAVPLINYPPPTPLIARKKILVGKQVEISNKTNSKTNNLPKAFWSGEKTTIKIEGVPATIDVISDDGSLNGGTGIYDNHLRLRNLSNDDFFENFFSLNKQEMKNKATLIDCSKNCTGDALMNENELAIGQIIWIETFNKNSTDGKLMISKALTLGTLKRPVLLIIDGSIQLNHIDATINGLIYTTKNFNNKKGAGNIHGSLISEGNINAEGKLKIAYNNEILRSLKNNTARYVRIPGSWKDF